MSLVVDVEVVPEEHVRDLVRESGVVRERLQERLRAHAAEVELGVHVITVYRWLAGQRRPRGELAEKYRRLLQDLAALVAEEQGK